MKKYQKYIFYFENSFPVYNWVQRLFCIKAWNLIAGGEIVHCIKKIYYATYLKPTKSTLLFRNGLNCQKIYFTCVCLVVVIIIIKWYRNGLCSSQKVCHDQRWVPVRTEPSKLGLTKISKSFKSHWMNFRVPMEAFGGL